LNRDGSPCQPEGSGGPALKRAVCPGPQAGTELRCVGTARGPRLGLRAGPGGLGPGPGPGPVARTRTQAQCPAWAPGPGLTLGPLPGLAARRPRRSHTRTAVSAQCTWIPPLIRQRFAAAGPGSTGTGVISKPSQYVSRHLGAVRSALVLKLKVIKRLHVLLPARLRITATAC
jgi:hypothetical protein